MNILLLLFIFIFIYIIIYTKNIYENFGEMTSDEINACNKFKKIKSRFKIKQLIYTDILRRTKKALDELNIPFFLSSGTCLGYLRENKFLDHDYDIDVGIYSKDYTPEIVKVMAKHKLLLYRTMGTEKDGLELSFRLNGTKMGRNAKIDIFLHYPNEKTGKTFWTSYEAPYFEKQIKYQVSNFKLKQVKFMGLKINVPNSTVKYIREHYGENWYVPIKTKAYGGTYDYRYTPKSIVT